MAVTREMLAKNAAYLWSVRESITNGEASKWGALIAQVDVHGLKTGYEEKDGKLIIPLSVSKGIVNNYNAIRGFMDTVPEYKGSTILDAPKDPATLLGGKRNVFELRNALALYVATAKAMLAKTDEEAKLLAARAALQKEREESATTKASLPAIESALNILEANQSKSKSGSKRTTGKGSTPGGGGSDGGFPWVWVGGGIAGALILPKLLKRA